LAEAAHSDKKRRGGSLTLVVPHGVGDTGLHTIPVAELEAFLERGMQP
jgi:3-dehydroquinate synthase